MKPETDYWLEFMQSSPKDKRERLYLYLCSIVAENSDCVDFSDFKSLLGVVNSIVKKIPAERQHKPTRQLRWADETL